MNDKQQRLYDRLCAFEFTATDDPRPFARRLAEEQHWTAGFATRAIEEYRRFVLLACAAGHPVCPSEAVDEVWHLHLIYTRCYWQRFCGEVLGEPLHHEPSRGGAAEHDKHRSMYRATLAKYREVFGHNPPADLWPDVDTRFAHRFRASVIDLSRYWLIRKPRLGRKPGNVSVSALTMPLLSGELPGGAPLLAVTNPYDWRGPDFLTLYVCLVVVALVAGYAVRCLVRRSGPVCEPDDLDAYELAYLAGGEKRCVNAAVTRLLRAGNLMLVTSQPPRFRFASRGMTGTHSFEQATLAAVPPTTAGANLRVIELNLRSETGKLRDQLRDHGLIVGPIAQLLGRLVPLVFVASLILFGLGKVAVGLDRQRPVSILLACLIATAILGLIVFARRLLRTDAGERYLAKVRRQYVSLESTARRHPEDLSPQLMATALGLFGATLLARTAYARTPENRESWHSGLAGGFTFTASDPAEGHLHGGSGCGGGADVGGGSGDGGGGGDGDGGGGCGGGCGGCGGG